MRATLRATIACAAILTAACSTYREPPSPDIVPGRLERGDRVRILTNDGERFHAIVDHVEDGWVTVRNKEYRYQDGVQSGTQRGRERYAMAELTTVLVEGRPRLHRKAVTIALMALYAISWIVAPVYRD